MTRNIIKNDNDCLLSYLKYNYLSIEIDEGYFSHKKYSFKISYNKIKYNDLNILPGEEYSREFPRRFRTRDPKRSWMRKYNNDLNYLKDFYVFISKIKDLVIYSNKCDYDVLDGPSCIIKLSNCVYPYSYLGDSLDCSDSSYREIIELVREFAGKWAKDCFLQWSEEDKNKE